MGNPMCDLPANAYEVKVTKGSSSKPVVPKNKAVIGNINAESFTSINPGSTPNSAYMKRVTNRK